MVECARLESECTVLSRTEGPNPSLSARNKEPRKSGVPCFWQSDGVQTLATQSVGRGFDKFVRNKFGRTQCARRVKTRDGFQQSLLVECRG